MKKKVVAFVPIKLNSQRLPHKNILPLAGHPLCWHMVSQLLQIQEIDETYVFCSNEAIRDYIPEEAVFLKRDAKLDLDAVKGFEIYDAFIQEIDADIYILAHTTSPFIKSETIANALRAMLENRFDSAFSAQKIQTFAWYKGQPINYNINDVPRTQDLEPLFVETSAFFMFEKEIFTKHRRRIGFHPFIQEVDAMEAVDIDTKEDYDFAVKLTAME